MPIMLRPRPTSPTTLSAFITASASIQHWPICGPPSMNGKWQNVNLSWCRNYLTTAAIDVLREARARIDGIEGPHDSPSPHNYDHINYTTESGVKGTIRVLNID